MGAVNADDHKDLGSKYGIKGFPTIKIFGGNKNKPEDYSGARTARGLVDAALAAVKTKVNSNLRGESGGSDFKVTFFFKSLMIIYKSVVFVGNRC